MISPAIPFAFVVVPAYIIACKSEDHIFEQHPALYILAFGLVAAKVTNRLVVSSEFHIIKKISNTSMIDIGRSHDSK